MGSPVHNDILNRAPGAVFLGNQRLQTLARVVDEMLAVLRDVEVRVGSRLLLRQPLEDVQHRDCPVGLARTIKGESESLQGRR